MTAVAALWSGARHANPSQVPILLFHNTATGQLAVSSQNSTSSNPGKHHIAADNTDHDGIIRNPSHMASCVFMGLQLVVAVTKPKDGDDTASKNQISIVSPGYERILLNSKAHPKVAMSASNTEAWVYFLDGSSEKTHLMEHVFSNKSNLKYLTDGEIKANSSLAAYFDSETQDRFVIYQATGSGLQEFNVNQGTPPTDISGEIKPIDNTPLAVTFHEGRVYLYFVAEKDTLHRITKTETGWDKDSKPVTGAPKIASPDAQVTVVWANGANHIFYMNGTDEFSADPRPVHILDKLV